MKRRKREFIIQVDIRGLGVGTGYVQNYSFPENDFEVLLSNVKLKKLAIALLIA